jgi:hypothetical protein
MKTKFAPSLAKLWDLEDRFSALAGSAVGRVPVKPRPSAESVDTMDFFDAYFQDIVAYIRKTQSGWSLFEAELVATEVFVWTFTEEIVRKLAVRDEKARRDFLRFATKNFLMLKDHEKQGKSKAKRKPSVQPQARDFLARSGFTNIRDFLLAVKARRSIPTLTDDTAITNPS